MDDPETNRRFAESLELDYPILSDPSKDVANAYGVLSADRVCLAVDDLHRRRRPGARY